MDPFWNFMNHALNYWWLVFPLAGVFGGWRGGRGRRRRELRERGRRQYVGAGSTQPPYPGPSVQLPVPDDGQQRIAELRRVLAEHDAVNARWLDYELDVGKMIDFPMMSDVREPLTVDFLRAKRTADGLRPEQAGTQISEARLAEYRNAVHAFGLAFDIAEREAKRVKDRHYSEEERSRLATARKLTSIAEDAAATPSERQSAFRRVRKELDGLLVLPDVTLAELERRIQSMLQSRPPQPEPPASGRISDEQES